MSSRGVAIWRNRQSPSCRCARHRCHGFDVHVVELEARPDRSGPPRAGPSGELGPQLTAFFTSAPILASSAAVNSVRAKEVGHMAPSSRLASSLKPNVAYLDLNLCALWKKQTTLPSVAYAGIPYQVFGERA